jgi:uncharacterized membrane protein
MILLIFKTHATISRIIVRRTASRFRIWLIVVVVFVVIVVVVFVSIAVDSCSDSYRPLLPAINKLHRQQQQKSCLI